MVRVGVPHSVNDVQLEDDIRTILSALGTIKNASELVELEYEALRIDEKFDAENFILKNETQMQVVTYYRYIEKVFSNSNADFDMIASEIKVSSMKLEKAGLSQQDVISQLSEWIRNKAGLGTESLLACNIVVSFFIQNCEVFHNLNENGEVEIPREQIIGTASELFGDKVYADVEDQLASAVEEIQRNVELTPNPKKDELKTLREQFSRPIADTLMDSARAQYGGDLKKSTQKQLERRIQETTDTVVTREYGDYTIRDHQLAKEREDRIQEAQQSGATMAEITQIDEEYAARRLQGYRDMVDNISRKLHSDETVKKAAETIVETVETEKLNAEKDSIEGSVRDHLRGFSRTIPAFLMAYGDENTTLANFDALVPDEVFWEVTVNPQNGQGVTLDQFRMLRDGGDYVSENGEQKHFDGHLFDEVVFNDAVQEFMKKRTELANYFEPDHKGDIFDFIPPQRTNQIFTPKKVVKDMVDRLEQENPGCFDDPDATFADLYMKSGMYVTEIVTRLYQSKRMKALYPDEAERLNHIFAKQVFGCTPTEIIYRICLRYILGFSDEIHIEKNNIRLCDTLEYAKNGTMDAEMRKLFDL